MKSMKVYLFLIVGIIVLIGVAAFLTNMFMDLSVPDPSESQTAKTTQNPAATDVSATSETTIRLDQPTSALSAKRTNWRTNRKTSGKPDFTPPPPNKKPGIGDVSSIVGNAFARNKDNKRVELSKNYRIQLNDIITTGEGAKIKIIFDDGSIISQGENSVIIIDEFLYNPKSPEKNHFSMRFVKGVCRTVTGMITNLNPERYRVKTRMATIGIRGCDLIFRSSHMVNSIYVLDLAGEKLVVIETTKDGSTVTDMATNKDLDIDESVKTVINIDKPNQLVNLTKGKTPEQRSVSETEKRSLMSQCSELSPAKYEVLQESGGMTFQIQPSSEGNN